MSNRSQKLLISLALATLLAGCDSIPFIDNSSDYKTAGRGRPLEVPPDLTSISTDETYTVPGGTTYSTYSQGQATPQQEDKLLPSPDGVRLERAGSQRWLVVPLPPEKVWPIVREFWTDLGFAVQVESTKTGVMETEWADASALVKDESGNYLSKFQGWLDKLEGLNNRQKFRTRIDRTENDSETEIYMSHRSVSNAPGDNKSRTVTRLGVIDNGYKPDDERKNSTSEDIDAELLRRLMVKLGVAEQQSQTIMANPVQEKRASTSTDKNGVVTLTLNDPFDRAWRRVGLSLDRIGFVVEDRDRSRGLFYVRYSDLEVDQPSGDKKGLLSSLKFWGDDEDDKNKPKEPEPAPKKDDKGIVDKLKFWDSEKEKAVVEAQYRIKVDRGGDTTPVVVVDKNGKQDTSKTANRILNMLYEQLK